MFLKSVTFLIRRNNKFLPLLLQSQTSKSARITGVRFLYSAESLGLDKYKDQRNKTHLQFQDLRGKFYDKMKEFSDPESHNMVFTEDLKHILHLAESVEDVELVKKMLYKFNSQNKGLRFGNYTFGPVVMRLFHHLNKPDDALEVFFHKDFVSFFSQINSYQILMNLLYENERYQDVVEVFQEINRRQTEGVRYPKTVTILYCAALYKMNTPEAYELLLDLYEKLKVAGHAFVRRAVCFSSAFAINQKKYNDANEMLNLLNKDQNYVTVKNLKLLSMLGVKRYDDVLRLLQSILQSDVPEARLDSIKRSVLSDVIETIKLEFDQLHDVQLKADFTKLYHQLKEFDHIASDTLDTVLTQKILESRTNEYKRNNNFTRSRFNSDDSKGEFRQNNFRKRPAVIRPGLIDL